MARRSNRNSNNLLKLRTNPPSYIRLQEKEKNRSHTNLPSNQYKSIDVINILFLTINDILTNNQHNSNTSLDNTPNPKFNIQKIKNSTKTKLKVFTKTTSFSGKLRFPLQAFFRKL